MRCCIFGSLRAVRDRAQPPLPAPRWAIAARRNVARWLAIAVALAFAPAAPALDLLGAYRLAQENDATLQAARAAADAQRERLPQAQAQLRPNVTVSAGRSLNDLTRTQPNLLGQIVTSDERYFSSNAALTVRQPLYRPALRADVRVAESVVADAEATLRTEEQNLAARVTAAYFDALLASDQLALVRKQIDVARVQLDAATKAWQAGTGIRTDVDEIQARVDLLRAEALRAEQQVDLTRRQLAALIGQPPEPLATIDPARFVPRLPEPAALEPWLARAEAESPELQALRARRDAARHALDRAEAGHLPTLDAYVQIVRSASENVTAPRSSYTNRVIGLQFNLPLYAGGAIASAVRQAQAELSRAEAALEAARRDLAVRLQREHRAVVEGVARIHALERAVASAEQVVVSNRRSHQAGTRTLLDVLEAEQRLALTQRDLAQARYEYLIGSIRLAVVCGIPVDPWIEQSNQFLTRYQWQQQSP